MRVLKPLTSAAVTVFVTSRVLKENWYGFMDWIGDEDGFVWKECEAYDGSEAFDFVWFISPEFDLQSISAVAEQMKPALQLFYVHNGHMPEQQQEFNQLRALSPDLPLVGMAPHVAAYVTNRLEQSSQEQQLSTSTAQAAAKAEWLLPIWPFVPQQPCSLDDPSCFKGFSITGSLDKSLRNYGRMWEQITAYRDREGADALQNFKLNILGEVLGDFTVPGDLQQYVQLYKTPPDPVFYDVIYHSCGIVPALANPAYYTCKLTSAVITTLMTGVPVVADRAFLDAYSMLSPDTVYEQQAGEDELAAMFRMARLPSGTVVQTRKALEQLRQQMNSRCIDILLGWLQANGLQPDPASAVMQTQR